MGFRRLFLKEVRSFLPVYGIFAVAVAVLHLFIMLRGLGWQDGTILGLSLLLPFLFLSAIAVGTGFYQLFAEWRTNSIYLLLSLPLRGWKVMTAKLSAVLALLYLTLLANGISFAVFLFGAMNKQTELPDDIPEVLPDVLNTLFNLCWMYALTVIFLIALVQFAFLCGQLVAKFKWLVVIGAFFAALYLVLRIGPPVSKLLEWLPEIYFGGENAGVVYLNAGPFLILALLSAGFIWLSGYIFEKEVEV